MSAEAQRLLQAIEHFKARTRGAELPEGTDKALEGLSKVLGVPTADRNTPGGRAALGAAPGTRGTGEHISRSAKGPDQPSPGQRAAGVSAEIDKAAQQIVAGLGQ